VNNSVKSPAIRPRKNLPGTNKIPTIINGRVECGDVQNPSKSKMKISKVNPTKNNKYVHKVHIIGDSHFKGIVTKINQYLGIHYEVTGFIKPGRT
jgi:hypothetical protein